MDTTWRYRFGLSLLWARLSKELGATEYFKIISNELIIRLTDHFSPIIWSIWDFYPVKHACIVRLYCPGINVDQYLNLSSMWTVFRHQNLKTIPAVKCLIMIRHQRLLSNNAMFFPDYLIHVSGLAYESHGTITAITRRNACLMLGKRCRRRFTVMISPG